MAGLLAVGDALRADALAELARRSMMPKIVVMATAVAARTPTTMRVGVRVSVEPENNINKQHNHPDRRQNVVIRQRFKSVVK